MQTKYFHLVKGGRLSVINWFQNRNVSEVCCTGWEGPVWRSTTLTCSKCGHLAPWRLFVCYWMLTGRHKSISGGHFPSWTYNMGVIKPWCLCEHVAALRADKSYKLPLHLTIWWPLKRSKHFLDVLHIIWNSTASPCCLPEVSPSRPFCLVFDNRYLNLRKTLRYPCAETDPYWLLTLQPTTIKSVVPSVQCLQTLVTVKLVWSVDKLNPMGKLFTANTTKSRT
jgi:hypothetical protein